MADDKEALVPEIRFKGFTDVWELRKLEDCTSKIGDGLHGTPKYSENGDIAFINGNNLVNGKILLNEETKRVTPYQQSKDDKELNDRTILISINGTIGNLALYNGEKLMLGKSAAYIEVSSIEIIFLYQLLQTNNVKTHFLNNLTGTTIKNLGLKIIRETPIRVPVKEEQTIIGNFFYTLDDAITSHKRKLDGLRKLKSGYLQQMFPQAGECVPRIRFEGFFEPWEQRKLGEVAEFNPHSVLPTSFEYVDLESVVGTSLISHRTENKDTAPSRAQRLAQKGDVFFQTVRPYQKNNFLFDMDFDNYVFSTGYAQLRPLIDSYFLFCKLQEEIFIAKVLDNCTGTSYPAINSTDLSLIEIDIAPVMSEQTAIGNFFQNLDKQIAAQQTKLDKLAQLKAAYLQKMFI